MRILYEQAQKDAPALKSAGIGDCYLKWLVAKADKNSITKLHHHTFFEIHIVAQGMQLYEVCGKQYKLESGNWLIISPCVPHRLIASAESTEKFAFSFNIKRQTDKESFMSNLTDQMQSGLDFIEKESRTHKELSGLLVENRVCELVISMLRYIGLKEEEAVTTPGENAVLSFAKQYIYDNIEQSPTVSEVAQYCNLSARQLTRIFYTFEGVSPSEYITNRRIKKIEQLILEDNISLRDISDLMNFSNEYYFNVFFKAHFGIPPGQYRKMHGK